MQSLPDDHIDLTVTSPPYDNLRSYRGVGDEWNFETFKPIARELFRVTKIGGVCVWIVADATIDGSETGTSFRQALYFMECGFRLHDTMIYEKQGGGAVGSNRAYWHSFEYMFVFTKKYLETFNPIKDLKHAYHGHVRSSSRRNKNGNIPGKKLIYTPEHGKRRNIWKYAVGWCGTTIDKIAFKHPAIFPEKLAQDHIISWSNPGDLVFDPFMGSGTVGKQCELLRRRWLGCDKVEEYCSIAAKRIDAAASQKTFEDYL